ncbi:MAG: amidophosphoribosyltransferase [Planctomycetes bacterium RBG_13_63_9]|nr:MAG: amidophosphoribosyltransferase [Planctomycetes bacterium RBG_13_63_9]
MTELHDECGIAAIYHLPGRGLSPLCTRPDRCEIGRLMPRMLLDIQNRGQLSAGMTSYHPDRNQLIDTHKEIGSVSEVFRTNHRGKFESLMIEYTGPAAIGHVRYATCGRDDRSYAQPFERHHIKKHKWFSFAFNGQLANYPDLRRQLLGDDDNYLARETDTEIIMHEFCRALKGDHQPPLIEVCRMLAEKFDGAYSLVFLDALGNMMVVRDPLGIKPLSYAVEGPLFAAASESVALLNIGFAPESIESLPPAHAAIITDGRLQISRFAPTPRRAHCFFEWVYFSNVASTLDGRSVYLARKALGEELARLETLPIDEHTVVVPVPDTSKAAADAMAYGLQVPCVEGLIRNRYSGRSFIEGGANRKRKAETKYTPLRDVLKDKRVLLVEDSIVRGTTLKVLLQRIWRLGGPREIHVRVACPPIIAPCFYGIDMSTVSELLAPHYFQGSPPTDATMAKMAEDLEVNSLRYLPVDSISPAIGLDAADLCRACITGEYPTACGQKLAQIAIDNHRNGNHTSGRTYEAVGGGE